MKDIGLGHHIRGLDGCRLVTTERGSMSVTGMEIVAGLNMTTIGTGNATETMIGTATTVTKGARPSDAHKGRAGATILAYPKLRSGGNSAAL
jgi:hypothetical protein